MLPFRYCLYTNEIGFLIRGRSEIYAHIEPFGFSHFKPCFLFGKGIILLMLIFLYGKVKRMILSVSFLISIRSSRNGVGFIWFMCVFKVLGINEGR